MSLSYTLLGTIVGLLILFIYLVWLYVSSKHVWNKSEFAIAEKKNKRRWKNIVDKKNEELGWFDLGNHIIIIGVILFAIFIAKNA
jgi:predicted PurR-regulated permease PerM